MNPDTMTLDECRDFIAVAKYGFEIVQNEDESFKRYRLPGAELGWNREHPVNATIDAAAASLPEGWFWWKIHQNCDTGGAPIWMVDAYGCGHIAYVCGDTERLARFRCCVKAWMHAKGTT